MFEGFEVRVIKLHSRSTKQWRNLNLLIEKKQTAQRHIIYVRSKPKLFQN